jgi:hypothetical protein
MQCVVCCGVLNATVCYIMMCVNEYEESAALSEYVYRFRHHCGTRRRSCSSARDWGWSRGHGIRRSRHGITGQDLQKVEKQERC